MSKTIKWWLHVGGDQYLIRALYWKYGYTYKMLLSVYTISRKQQFYITHEKLKRQQSRPKCILLRTKYKLLEWKTPSYNLCETSRAVFPFHPIIEPVKQFLWQQTLGQEVSLIACLFKNSFSYVGQYRIQHAKWCVKICSVSRKG